MSFFRQLITVFLAVLFCLLAPEAQATDFSRNPFADSEKALINSRAATTLLNLSGQVNQQASPTNIIIRQSLPGRAVDDTTSAGIFSPYYGGWGRPGYLGYGYGYPGFGYGGYGYGLGFNPMMAGLASSAGQVPFYMSPYYGGYLLGPGLGFGYRGYRGYRGFGGFGGYGYGGFGYGGYGWGGFGWSPGAAALSMGAFGNWMDNEELGDMGSTGYVDNGPPSKSSGNYYAPSTPDPTAAGNYYSGKGPAVNMPIKPYTTPKNYWGPSGSPLPKDINKVPW